jgi:hypothetical protein
MVWAIYPAFSENRKLQGAANLYSITMKPRTCTHVWMGTFLVTHKQPLLLYHGLQMHSASKITWLTLLTHPGGHHFWAEICGAVLLHCWQFPSVPYLLPRFLAENTENMLFRWGFSLLLTSVWNESFKTILSWQICSFCKIPTYQVQETL